MDNKDIKDYYINGMYIEDIYAYTHANTTDKGIVDGVKTYANGYAFFSWPAALTESLWYVYRGMVKEAIIFDAVAMLLGGYLLHTTVWAGLLVFMALMIWRGMAAIPSYYKRLYRAIDQRGLFKRPPEEIPAVKESLAREGKPSVIRVIVYLILKCFVAVCMSDIVYTLVSINNIS